MENKQKEILKKLEKKGETCLLTDAPHQCSAFCLAALKPFIDNIVNLNHEMRIQSAILKETQASIRNCQNEVLNFPKILLEELNSLKSEIKENFYLVQGYDSEGMTGDENPAIPPGFRKIGTRYFHFSEDSANWTNARIGCQEKGGYLAVFQNREESIAVQSRLITPHWLGNKAQDGMCVYIHGQNTFTSACSLEIPYICEWDNKLN